MANENRLKSGCWLSVNESVYSFIDDVPGVYVGITSLKAQARGIEGCAKRAAMPTAERVSTFSEDILIASSYH